MIEVKDVMGKVVKIGDTVAFATAGCGASGFTYGVVSRFKGKKSVEIERINDVTRIVDGKVTTKRYEHYTTRQDSCFAIVEVCHEETK